MNKNISQHGLSEFFEEYLQKEPLFLNKNTLQSTYIPEAILHRAEEIKQMANVFAPSLKLERPSNLFLYGKTGTGKTVSIKYVINSLLNTAKSKNTPLEVIYVNCKLRRLADTEYRLVAHLARECGKQIPPTGLPTDEIYKSFFSAVDEKKVLLIIVLDEIDQLIRKAGDGVLYTLTRMNEELAHSKVAIVGISNDLTLVDNLDPRVKSSLSEEETLFAPYNALQIKDILDQRVSKAFRPGVIEEGVVGKCAAYAALEHGDARRALELLRVAGELAERNNQNKVLIKNVDEAEDKIDRDTLFDALETQPFQMQATLYSIVMISTQKKNNFIFTGEVYELYKSLCGKVGLRPLTQRRVSDLISELDMLGVITVRVISKGRYGRTREIKMAVKLEPKFWIRYYVFRDIRDRGYIIKTALKFGADFRIYDRGVKPGQDHARWVVYPVHEGGQLTWHEFAAKNRVAHSTKKRLLIGVVDDEGDVSYWESRWLRP